MVVVRRSSSCFAAVHPKQKAVVIHQALTNKAGGWQGGPQDSYLCKSSIVTCQQQQPPPGIMERRGVGCHRSAEELRKRIVKSEVDALERIDAATPGNRRLRTPSPARSCFCPDDGEMETDYSLFIRTHSLRGHIHQNYISKEKCNEKERKGGAGPRLEENGNQVDARGLPPSFKEEQAILEHVPSSSSFFSSSFICPTVPHFVFLSAEAIHLYTCQLQQLAPPVDDGPVGVWPR